MDLRFWVQFNCLCEAKGMDHTKFYIIGLVPRKNFNEIKVHQELIIYIFTCICGIELSLRNINFFELPRWH